MDGYEQSGDGHSWLSIYDPATGTTTYYASYPDYCMAEHNLQVMSGATEVTIDAEAQFQYYDGVSFRFHELTADEAAAWNAFMAAHQNWNWTFTNNCTSFA